MAFFATMSKMNSTETYLMAKTISILALIQLTLTPCWNHAHQWQWIKLCSSFYKVYL